MRSDSGVRCKVKRVRDGIRGVRVKEHLQYFLTKALSDVPDTGIPYDWFILTALVNTWRFITLLPTFSN